MDPGVIPPVRVRSSSVAIDSVTAQRSQRSLPGDLAGDRGSANFGDASKPAGPHPALPRAFSAKRERGLKCLLT